MFRKSLSYLLPGLVLVVFIRLSCSKAIASFFGDSRDAGSREYHGADLIVGDNLLFEESVQ